jgi:hypothetical protein
MLNTDLSTVSFEIAQISREHVLGVMFPKSKANAYPAVVAICKGAERYWEAIANGLLHHFAAFGRTPEQIARALAVANYANTMTAARFYARGLPLVDVQALYESLKCFVQSQQCSDPRAHCIRIVEAKGARYFVPCAFLADRWAAWPFDPTHPATRRDQFQALAVKAGCDWCPNFDASRFNRVHPSNLLEFNPSGSLED